MTIMPDENPHLMMTLYKHDLKFYFGTRSTFSLTLS